MKQTKYHYIFGTDAIKLYEESKEQFIEEMKTDMSLGAIYEYDELKMSPNCLLDMYSGWESYIEISEQEFIKYQKEIYG